MNGRGEKDEGEEEIEEKKNSRRSNNTTATKEERRNIERKDAFNRRKRWSEDEP